ncbi:MAG: thiamine-phosphate kinase [Armatimonadetes bacterium]|nr:thiamine-phosphate kinase [Armatimonadota bacterium]
MRISEFGGEPAIIRLIEGKYAATDDRVVLAFGDDAALVRASGGKLIIVTTDLLAENTHFRRDIIDPYSLGWKSVAANISDIAAMGGIPTFGLVSIAVPDIEVEFVERLYDGMNDVSARFGSAIVGGDTNFIKGPIVINVAQLGEVEEGRQTLRSTARPGHKIVVTGHLGESLAGFKLLDKFGFEAARTDFPEIVERHIRPVPRVQEARAATEHNRVRAMMDLSDGLGIDLPKLCAASGVGARVYVDKLPISSALKHAAADLDVDPTALAASGGEDYELLMAVDPSDVEAVVQSVEEKTGTTIRDIGEFVEGQDAVLVYPDGRETPMETGWKHF